MQRRIVFVAAVVVAGGALACGRSDSAGSGAAASDSAIGRDLPPVTSTVPDTGDASAGAPGTPPPTRRATPPVTPPAVPPLPAPAPLSIPAPDSARGIVRLVGNDPVAVLVLTPADESAAPLLSLAGKSQPLLRSVTGLEVVISGRQTSDIDMTASPRGAPRFLVDDFLVVAADGRAAHDGVLERVNGDYRLRLADGSQVRIGELPVALQGQVGARIYLVGPLDRAPQAWGVIRAP